MILICYLSILFLLFVGLEIAGQEQGTILLSNHPIIPIRPTQPRICKKSQKRQPSEKPPEELYRQNLTVNILETFIIKGKSNRAGKEQHYKMYGVAEGGGNNSFYEDDNRLTLEFYSSEKYPDEEADIFQIVVRINPGQGFDEKPYTTIDPITDNRPTFDYKPHLQLRSLTPIVGESNRRWTKPMLPGADGKPDTFIQYQWFNITIGKTDPIHVFDIRVHFATDGFEIYVGINRVAYKYPYAANNDDENRYNFTVEGIRAFGTTYRLLSLVPMPYVGRFPENYIQIDDTVLLWAIPRGDFEIQFYGDEDETLMKVVVEPEKNKLYLSAYVKNTRPECKAKGCWGNEANINIKDMGQRIKKDGSIEKVSRIRKGESFELAIKMTREGYEFTFYGPTGEADTPGPAKVKYPNGDKIHRYTHVSDFNTNRPYQLFVDKQVDIMNLEIVKAGSQ